MKKQFFLIGLCLMASVLVTAQVSKTVDVTAAGTLSNSFIPSEKTSVTNLTLTGFIDARDIRFIRDQLTALSNLDLGGSTIQAYSGTEGTDTTTVYPANEMPRYSFRNDTIGPKLTLKSVVLPNTITSIGKFAFNSCRNLSGNLIIPGGVVSIGDAAFTNCISLTGTLSLPNPLAFIGDAAFSNCISLTGTLSLPNPLAFIGRSAFANCTGFTGTLAIPNSIVNISESTFNYCTGLTEVLIPSSVKSIGGNAFGGCAGLKSITIQSGITSIGPAAFQGCSGMTFNVDASNPNYSSVDGILFNKDKTKLLQGMIFPTGSYTVPSTVAVIDTAAFEGCNTLKSIVIPSAVKTINIAAFNACISLTKVDIQSALTTINPSVFYGCSSLTSVQIPSTVTSIGMNAFNYCLALPSINIPAGVTMISQGAFAHCGASISVDANNANYSGKDGILYNKQQTSLIQCPITKTEVNSIPLTVTTVEENAFSYCAKLASISLPSSISNLGYTAFNYCNGLKYIYCFSSTPPAAFGWSGVRPTAVYVPATSLTAYQSSAGWGIFKSVMQANSSCTLTVQTGNEGQLFFNDNRLPSGIGISTPFSVSKGTPVPLKFVPDPGYEIGTATLNGVDVKPKIVNGEYIVAINDNSTLIITYKHSRCILSIKSAQSGSVDLFCEYGSRPTFRITTESDWHINSVMLNGILVTDSLGNGVYTLPPVTGNSVLNITFEFNTALNAVSISKVRVYSIQSEIIVEGTSPGENIQLYTLDGVQLVTIKSKGEQISIPVNPGAVYLVKTNSKTVKVLL